MPLAFKAHGLVAEVTGSLGRVTLHRSVCGDEGFSFADFTYVGEGRADMWTEGARIGTILAPLRVRTRHTGACLDLETETVIARSAGSQSCTEWFEGMHARWFTIAPETIERFFAMSLARVPFRTSDMVAPAETYPALAHIMSAIATDLLSDNPNGRLFIECLCSAALSALVDLSQRERQPHRGLSSDQAKRLRELIIARSGEPLALADLAEAVGLSVGHMLRSFKTTFGMTPHQYLIRERVERASRILKTTTMGLDEIARETGFGTKSQMARTFRATVGISPSAAR